jgi:hypothetical protein
VESNSLNANWALHVAFKARVNNGSERIGSVNTAILVFDDTGAKIAQISVHAIIYKKAK